MSIFNPDCTLCPLHANALEVCVPGRGSKMTAGIVIVGDKPSPSPESRELLRRSLDGLAGIELNACYVTSAIKCEVEEDVKPTRSQEKICATSYLLEEFDRLQPRFVLVMGNTAMKAVAGKSGILKYHGSVWNLEISPEHHATVMATLHPSAVLRNPKHSQAFGMAISRFGRLTRGEDTSPITKIVIVNDKPTLRRLLLRLADADEISWDIETVTEKCEPPYVSTNFQEWRGDKSMIASISFTWKPGLSFVIPLWHPRSRWKNPQQVIDLLQPVLTRSNAEYVGHNGKFDSRWMAAKNVVVPQTFDTMLAAHMLDENRPKGLKSLAQNILGADGYDVGEELKDARDIPLKRLCVYNGKDTDYTFRLKKVFEAELSIEPRVENVFRKLMMPASEALVDIERAGVWVDPQRWQERHDTAMENREKLHDYIQRRVPDSLKPLNLNSPQQMGRFLFGHLELPVLTRTTTGAPSTGESVLLRLAAENRVATALIKYRKWAKYLSTYILPWWFEHRDDTGRIHSNYKLFGTVTGRLSGEGGIQQVPRDPFIRSIIGAPEGTTFVVADYSQVELRIAAMLSNESRMLRQYAAGDDIHMIRAMRMTGKPAAEVEKEERKKAKAVNFGYIYGMGAAKFVTYAFDSYQLVVSHEEAQADRDGFFEDYPALRVWHERQRRLANRYHRVSSPIGRVRHLTDILSLDSGVRGEAERQAINSPVQSFASDLMLIALIRLHRILKRRGWGRIVGTVHDSILFEILNAYVNMAAPLIKRVMEDMDYVAKNFGAEVTVPIVADIEIGTHWGETKGWTQ